MTTLTARLDQKKKAVTAAALDRYHALVRAYAMDEPIDDDHADGVLSAAGKSAKDLETAAAVYKRRLLLVQEIVRGPDAKRRKEQVIEQQTALHAKRAALNREIDALLAPLNAEARQLDQIIERADRGAPNQLRQDCPYPERHAAIREIETRISTLREEQYALERKAREWDHHAAALDRQDIRTTAHVAAAKSSRAEAAKLRAEKAGLGRRIDELEKE